MIEYFCIYIWAVMHLSAVICVCVCNLNCFFCRCCFRFREREREREFHILKPELDVDPDLNPHFDARRWVLTKLRFWGLRGWISNLLKKASGQKRPIILNLRVNLEKHRRKSRRRISDINPNLIEVAQRVMTKEKPDPIPDIEWWDLPLL